jgi:hypothetical protein
MILQVHAPHAKYPCLCHGIGEIGTDGSDPNESSYQVRPVCAFSSEFFDFHWIFSPSLKL